MKSTIFYFALSLASASSFAQIPKGKIVFASADTNDRKHCELYMINSDGTGEHRVTHTGKAASLPSVAGNNIVYRLSKNNSDTVDFETADKNGNHILTLIKQQVVCFPRFSPDGLLIAYENYNTSPSDIWIMDKSGRNQHLLIKNGRHPYWYDGGRKMVFTRDYEIWSIDLKTHTEKQLTHLGGQHIPAKFPTISPDGTTLAFTGYQASPHSIAVIIVDLETGKQRILDGLTSPWWTNDPHYLVCVGDLGKREGSSIVMVNTTTGKITPITHNGRDNYDPAWVADE